MQVFFVFGFCLSWGANNHRHPRALIWGWNLKGLYFYPGLLPKPSLYGLL
jgi:hypothetical protein